MKLSYFTSKVLFGLSLGTLLSSNAMAANLDSTKATTKAESQSIDIIYTDMNGGTSFGDYFSYDKNSNNWTTKENFDTTKDTTINLKVWDLLDGEGYDKLTINMDKDKTLTFKNQNTTDGQNPAYVANLNATAKEVKGEDVTFEFFTPSVINGNFTLQGSIEAPSQDETFGSILNVVNGTLGNESRNGALTINGDFNADKTLIMTRNTTIKVNGIANIKNSNLGVLKQSYSELEAKDYAIIQAKDFNADILEKATNNNTGAILLKGVADYITDKTLLNDKQYREILDNGITLDISDEDGEAGVDLVDYKLSVKNCGGVKCLVINGSANESAKNLATQLQVDLTAIDKIIADLGEDEVGYELVKANLEAQKTELNKLLEEAKQNGGKIDDNKYIDLVVPELKNNVSDKNAVLALRSITDKLGSIGADLASREGVKLALQIKKDTDDTGKSVGNLNSSSSAVNTTMNIANDVSIGQRVAMLNNPYGSYVSRLSNLKFASNAYNGNYLSNYNQSVWTNAFGGANIIDGNSGALYGVSIGVDKQANENVLFGTYFTYANSKVKDTNIEQESKNFQLGLYSTIDFASDWESNIKAYFQISNTDQSASYTGIGNRESDYNAKYFGISANIGKVFDFSGNTLFIKPFAGINYYYSYIPSFIDKNALGGFKVDSMTNNSLSLELGAEFKKYMNESSYFFITPKIEQFVLNDGDDYSANLALNNTFFTSVKANDKKKTYAQVIIGGNVDMNERLSFNAGIGAKQILAGKVDNKNETYVSGQVGFKYKF